MSYKGYHRNELVFQTGRIVLVNHSGLVNLYSGSELMGRGDLSSNSERKNQYALDQTFVQCTNL